MNTSKYLLYIIAVPLLAVLGYTVMHGLFYVMPIKGNDGMYLGVTAAIIILGLAIPYLMMKSGFKGAQMSDPNQKPLKLDDLSKDQQQLGKRNAHESIH